MSLLSITRKASSNSLIPCIFLSPIISQTILSDIHSIQKSISLLAKAIVSSLRSCFLGEFPQFSAHTTFIFSVFIIASSFFILKFFYYYVYIYDTILSNISHLLFEFCRHLHSHLGAYLHMIKK